ncbi:MAG TPA: hypothetical protein PKD83_08440 [Ignavibacteria bacterium]|nr:hypothetical protein [Ignavibacteria bacterium]
MRKLNKIIGYLIKGRESNFIESILLGINVRVLEGTIREKVDQDDSWFYYLAKNTETVFDIGSNIGYMSLLAALQPNIKQIFLVDPNPEAL